MNKCDVIIVTFNRMNYLRKLLENIEGESKFINKTIIFDDCSNDGTREFLSSYAGPLKLEIIFAQKKSSCIGVSRNIALDNVESEYVAVLDDDDLLPPYKISHSIEIMEELNKDWVFGNCIEFSENSERYISINSDFRRLIWGTNNIRWVTTLFKSDTLKKVRFNDNVRIITDWLLYCDLVDAGNYPAISNRCLGFYRLHDNSISNDKKTLIQDIDKVKDNYKHWGSYQYLARSRIVDRVLKDDYKKALILWCENLYVLGLRKSIRLMYILFPRFYKKLKSFRAVRK